jgi:tRNA modification GTPase
VSATQFQLVDTIGALASAVGPAARGIVRISGPRAIECLNGWFEPAGVERWQLASGAASHAGGVRLDGLRSLLDVTVYAWPNGHSFTGQPLVEIHAPGSPPLLDAVLARSFAAGVRPAQPGEFTLRAFLAGRMDLLQAEAVLGVIDAAGEDALTIALRQLAGGISGRMTQVRGDLIDLLADLEAGLDFVEDGIEFVSRDELAARINRAQSTLSELLAKCQSRAQSHGRCRVVLAGLPNAGKSTLFNALLARDAALVSAVAGTTRDYLSGPVEWSGVAVELIDTPGWESFDATDQEADDSSNDVGELTRRAQGLGAEQREHADLVVWCSAADAGAEEERHDFELRRRAIRNGRPMLLVETKCDLREPPENRDAVGNSLPVSAKTGAGLDELVERCARLLNEAAPDRGEIIGTTAARCRESVAACRDALGHALAAAESNRGDEILALELREALEHLGRVLGTVYTDDILDRIFSRFCIGK